MGEIEKGDRRDPSMSDPSITLNTTAGSESTAKHFEREAPMREEMFYLAHGFRCENFEPHGIANNFGDLFFRFRHFFEIATGQFPESGH